MNQNQVKQKLKVLNTSATQQIITDVLKYIGEEADETDVTDEEYGNACRRIVQVLKGRYKAQITKEVVISKQVDIESAIVEIRKNEVLDNYMKNHQSPMKDGFCQICYQHPCKCTEADIEKWKEGNVNNYKNG